MAETSGTRFLLPYAFFALTLGLGWFILAPLVPYLALHFHVSLALILLLISLYGYAMIAGALPAGYWVARSGPKAALQTAVGLSVAGLALRAIAGSFTMMMVGQIIAALAYPFLIAPIGSVLRLGGVKALRRGTGMVIGTLFMGMAIGSFIGPALSPAADLWLALLANLVSGIWLWTQLSALSVRTSKSVGKTHLVISWWWIVGFVVASISVMFGSISTSALVHLRIVNAEALGGLLSGLTFMGSGFGAIIFGWLGEGSSAATSLQRLLGILTLVFLLFSGLLLTGALSPSKVGLDAAFFLFGLFSNGWYALSLESAAEKARSRSNAGIATAGYSMASNIGVALVPVVVGPLVISAPTLWLGIIAIMAVIAVLVPFLAKTPNSESVLTT